MLDTITPLILTFNEEDNLDRTLAKLRWAQDVVVLDSGSTDRTHSICKSYANVRMIVRPFDSHASQWNFGLTECGIESDWVLALDADYVLSDAFIEEMKGLAPEQGVAGYQARFRYCVFGRPLSKTLYPPVVALYRRAGASYRQDGHTQRLIPAGKVQELSARIYHDDRKPFSRWLASQDNYSRLEAELLLNSSWSALKLQDRLRRMMFITPWLVPLYCLTVGRGLLDGWTGMYYALQRGVAESILALRLIELHLTKRGE